MRPCNRYKGRVCAKEEESVSVVKGRKGRGARIHFRTTEERVY